MPDIHEKALLPIMLNMQSINWSTDIIVGRMKKNTVSDKSLLMTYRNYRLLKPFVFYGLMWTRKIPA